MATLMQVGITGGIGAGKSLVCKIFASLGVPVYDADSRAKKLMTTDKILIRQIEKEFGNLSYHSNGSLNKEYLKKVFGQVTQLNKLNKLVHPQVAHDYSEWRMHQSGSIYVLKEAALLIESGSEKILDKLIVVSSPIDIRIARVQNRDLHRTEQEIQYIMGNQLSEQERLNKADYVIVNDGIKMVIPQVLKLHKRFLSMG